jgi:kynurenine formamidase
MQVAIQFGGRTLLADLSKGVDLSLPVSDITRAWYIAPPRMEPVRMGETWVGSVELGGAVNFFDIGFNPHAHCTHTECLGHISKARESVNGILNKHWFVAAVLSVKPEMHDEDAIITLDQLLEKLPKETPEAIIIRTLPNSPAKMRQNMSGSNWPYLEEELAAYLCSAGVQHLLIDQPSVDREEDGGSLAAHRAFWNYPNNPRREATITELIFVPDQMSDGLFLLNLQVAPFENDASPSRPVVYPLMNKN